MHPISITIARESDTETFSIASTKAITLLAALYEIKATLDPTLTFGAGCRSGICGSCAVLVNGKEQLACSYRYQDGDHIAPLRYHPVLRDLKVDKTYALDTLTKILSRYSTPDPIAIAVPSPKEEAQTKVQTDCILCDSCYSACPVLAVNPDFLGPFALTRAWRYLANSPKENNPQDCTDNNASLLTPHSSLLDAVQTHGIWDCTLCGECTAACPQGIDPKTDILMLRGVSGKAGYSDPNFAGMDFGTPDFGFNSNGGF